jgi:electron transfer flavoprotein beta subunit
MEILILISHVPDTTTKIKFDATGKALDSTGVTFIINPYDEFSLVRALELKEAGKATKVVALCVGGPDVEPTIRRALAIGADEGVRIDAPAQDAAYVARQIAAYAQGKNYSLIMAGKESIDNNGSEVPGMVAELLDLPFVSFATWLEVEGDRARLKREIDGGMEELEGSLPLVLSAQKGLAEWRIPNMRGIMAARTKPLAVVPATQAVPDTHVLAYELPAAKASTRYFEPGQEADLLKALVDKGALDLN